MIIPLSGMDFKQHKILLEAISYFGEIKQQTVAIEEMAELTQQLCKLMINHPNKSREKMVEEFSDVLIMLCQMEIIFNISPTEVKKIQENKLSRIKEIIKKEKS